MRVTMISKIVGDQRVKWSRFKDDRDVSKAQRTQDLDKIAREARPSESFVPTAWKPKWQRERDEALEAEALALEKAKLALEAAEKTAADGESAAGGVNAPSARLKPRMQLCFLGPPSGGKSCLLGHLYYITGGVAKSKVEAYEKKCMEMGQGGSKMAWVVSKHKIERERGMSVCCARLEIQTERYLLMGVDTPNKKGYSLYTIELVVTPSTTHSQT